MSEWEKVRLGDVCDIQSGGTPSRIIVENWQARDRDPLISWVKISDMKQKYVNSTEEKITSRGLQNSSAKVFPAGTILYTIFATLGEASILLIDAATNQAIAGITVPEWINTDFLYYYLISIKKQVLNIGRGVAQNNINLSILRDFQISLPPMNIQKRIVNILDAISLIIEKRKEQIKKLDLLVKSRFVGMFGDRTEWTSYRLGDICELKAGKFISASEIKTDFIEKLFPCYGGNGLRGYVEKYTHEGDFPLIGRQGALCGNIQYAQGKFYATEHAIVTCPKIKINTMWLYYELRQMNLNRLAIGAAQPGLTVEKLNGIIIQLPPLALQTRFAEFVKQVDKTKFVAQQGLEKLELCYKALMQQFFG